jgi:hypothetical protein
MLAFYRIDPENIFNLSSSVESITFDSTIINNISNEEIFYISATGNATETVFISSSNELFGYSSSSFELVGGQSPIPIELVFSPDTIGQKSGSLYLSSSNGDTLNISLNGLAIPEPLILKSSVENIYFPSLYIGSSSQSTFTVTADEDNIETVTLSDDSDQFSFSPASFVLTGGVTIQTVTASFTPTSLGSKTGNLTLTSTSGSTLIIQLDGAGVHTALVLTSSVSVLSFSGTYINTTSSNTFTVSAAGSGQIENITVTDNTNQFNFSPSNFYLTGGGSPQIVSVDFAPTSIGVKSGLITFSSSGGDLLDVALSGSGIILPLFLTSSVESLVFPETSLRTIKRKTFNVTAGGTGSALVYVRESLPDFVRSPPSFNLVGSDISPDIVTITFYPYSYGIKTGLVTLTSSQGQVKYIQVTGTCTPPPAILRLNKTNMIFANTFVGSSSSQIFTVSALGVVNETVVITDNSSYFSFNPSNFLLSGSSPSVVITGSFNPDSKSLFTGLVTVSASRGSVKTLRVTGSGIYAPLILTSSVNSIDFGTFYVGTSNFVSYSVSAGGLGSETVTVSDNSSQFSFNTLTFPLTGGGSSYPVTASFNPTRTGTSTGIMTLSASGGNIKNISLTGSAVYAPLILTSSLSVLNFPNTALNNSSSLSFSISAGGLGGTETITLSDNSSDFSFSTSSFNLSAGGSTFITGTFSPITTGSKTGILTVSSSGGDVKNIALSGTAEGAQQIMLSSSVSNINFGNVAVGTSSLQTFIVTAVSGVGTETINASSSNNIFILSPTSFNLTGSGDSRIVTASFTPSSITSSFGTITLSASGGDIETLTITGSGIDPYLALTSVLLRGDGSNGSTTFIDSSPYNIPISSTTTGGGQVFISTAQSVYGGSSIFFNGSGSLLNVGTGSAVGYAPLDLGSADWTLEFWCNPLSSSLISKTVYGNYGATTNATNRYLFRFSAGKFGFYHRVANTQYNTTTTIPFGTWSHLAVSRQGSTIRIFYNGNLENTISSWTRAFDSDPLHAPTIGGYWQDASTYGPQGWYAGYLDNFRLTKGIARYTGSFTPPGAY